MAKYRLFAGANLTLPLTKATAQTAARTSNGALSGDPVVIGQIPGVALIDADSSQKTVVQYDGVFDLLVAGKDASGSPGDNSVLGGEAVYFNKDHTPPLDVDPGGILFGYAVGDAGVELVAAGSNTTRIPVLIGK
jgi:predicted RecA/RadA family phage recombinase